MPRNQVVSTLSLKDFRLKAHLGCSPEERINPQEVQFSIDIGFLKNPTGEKSDNLADSVCYAEICESISRIIQEKEFNLIEKLAMDCLGQLKRNYPENQIRLSAHKLNPPIDNLNGGVVYSCGDQFD